MLEHNGIRLGTELLPWSRIWSVAQWNLEIPQGWKVAVAAREPLLLSDTLPYHKQVITALCEKTSPAGKEGLTAAARRTKEKDKELPLSAGCTRCGGRRARLAPEYPTHDHDWCPVKVCDDCGMRYRAIPSVPVALVFASIFTAIAVVFADLLGSTSLVPAVLVGAIAAVCFVYAAGRVAWILRIARQDVRRSDANAP